MPEILTESFCERCGTRYTFESAVPRAAKLKGIKVLSRGLKNFVMSDDTSMDEAMAAARSETDREVTSQQLDAFHKTFNFCMNCRQYTCANCWNEADGQCLSCAPHLGHEILPAPFPDLDPTVGLAMAEHGQNGANGHASVDEAPPMAWPTSDLMREVDLAAETVLAEESAPDDSLEPIEPIDAAARLAALGAIAAPTTPDVAAEVEAAETPAAQEADTPSAPAEAITASAAMPEVAPDAVAEPDVDRPAITEPATAAPAAATAGSGPATIHPDDVDGRAAAAAGQTAALLKRFRPGQNLDDEIAAYEAGEAAKAEQAARLAAAAAVSQAATPEPAPIIEPEPAPGAAVEPEVAAAAEYGAAEPVAAAPEALAPEPIAAEPIEPAPAEPVAAAPREDIVAQPTWQIVAPDTSPAPGVPEPATPTQEPQWPSQPEWPSQRPATGLPFLGRPAASPVASLESLWAESAREVATAPARPTAGVQPCVSCGLSLSATARFCRRCGTRQG